MTDDERQAILQTARDNVERLSDLEKGAEAAYFSSPGHFDPVRRNPDWRDDEPEPEPRCLDLDVEALRRASWDSWNAWCDERIQQALLAERERSEEVLVEVVAGFARDLRSARESNRTLVVELREVRIEFAKLQSALDLLREADGRARSGNVIDLKAVN
jgi:hypothetical protein